MTLGVKNYVGQETFSATLSADYQQLAVTFTTGPNAQTATIYGLSLIHIWMPDMYTDSFKCAMAPELPIDMPEGYAVTVCFVQALAEFLRKYGWQDKVVFHIHDEPDIHFKRCV